MKLTFKIDYYTRWGQQLYVVGNIPELGNGDEEKAFPLQYSPREEWSGSIETKDNKPFTLRYRYIVKESNGWETLCEWGGERTMEIGAKERECVFIDAWNSISDPNNTFTTTPFTDVLLRGQCKPCEGERPQRVTHEFSVKAPLLTGDEAVCIIGNCQELGEWRTENPLLMDNSEFPMWKAGIDASSQRIISSRVLATASTLTVSHFAVLTTEFLPFIVTPLSSSEIIQIVSWFAFAIGYSEICLI